MRKSLLRVLGLALVMALSVTIVACGKDASSGITFRNSTSRSLVGIYISSTTSDTWGEHVNSSTVKSGDSTVVSAGKLVDGAGVPHDVGALDDNDIVYEFYGVVLGEGYTVDINGNGIVSTPVLTVTDPNGGVTTYEGYAGLRPQ